METIASILNDHPYLSVVTVALGCIALVRVARRRRSDLPPGPRGYPIVGNLFDLPHTYIWEKFAEFGQQYGTLIFIRSSLLHRWMLTNLVCRRNHIPQRLGSENDNSQLVQSSRRSPRQEIIYLFRTPRARIGRRDNWVAKISGVHAIRFAIPGIQEIHE